MSSYNTLPAVKYVKLWEFFIFSIVLPFICILVSSTLLSNRILWFLDLVGGLGWITHGDGPNMTINKAGKVFVYTKVGLRHNFKKSIQTVTHSPSPNLVRDVYIKEAIVRWLSTKFLDYSSEKVKIALKRGNV